VYGVVTGIPPAARKYVRRVVMVHSEDGGAEGTIDDAGNYRIENAPLGNVWVSAFVESAARSTLSSARQQVEVSAAQPARVDLEIAGSVRVTGRITVDGRPVEAYVSFSSEDGMMAGAQTREDGAYEIALAGPGRFHIYARAEQFQERNFQTIREVRGGETIDIDLREQVVEGTVVDAVTRLPIQDAIVTLAPAGVASSIVAQVPTDANGRFRLVTAAAGALRVIASANGYAQRAVPVSGSSTQYAFELAPVPDLRIRVLDARNGAPLDAHVVFRDEAGILPVRPRRTADGVTYVFSVAPGTYQVMAIVQGYATKTIEVTAPGAADIAME
ncbi:MAG TPA: carboxypeptidase-like regulatory domain-containing protein, partial [Thermoanaerobaculia bacterium]|nr:carboxypeptidase-like regulatory domain-containing protein [Thermoanaerobaculia bacterium]